MKLQKNLKLKTKQGLHARPAAMFVESANRFNAKIRIRKGDLLVDGKSILNILMLGVEFGDEITVEIEGEDAQEALVALEEIVSRENV